MLHEAVHNADFRDSVKRTTGVTAQPFGICYCSEKDDCITADVNILLQGLPLFRREFRVLGIQFHNCVLAKWNRELGNSGHRHMSPSFFS